MSEDLDIIDDLRLGPYANVTNGTDADSDVSENHLGMFLGNENYIFIATAIFSVCYFLMGVTCCRCYWLHLQKKSETNRSIEGGLEAVVSKKDGRIRNAASKENVDEGLEIEEEPNEFLEPKWS